MIWLVCILFYAIMQVRTISETKIVLALLISYHRQPDAQSAIDWRLAAFLIVVNLVILACDLAEVNQWFHYTAFAALGIAAALRFAWLVVQHPRALDAKVRKQVLLTFAAGTLTIFVAFAVSF